MLSLFIVSIVSATTIIDISESSESNSFIINLQKSFIFNPNNDYEWFGHNIFHNVTVFNYTGIDVVNMSYYWGDNHYTSANIDNWDTAYSWGNHSEAGYLTEHQSLTDYWKSDGSSTATGNWDLGNNDLTVGGNIGIGTTAPSERFHIKGTIAQRLLIESDTSVSAIRQKTSNSDYGWYSMGSMNSFILRNYNLSTDLIKVTPDGKLDTTDTISINKPSAIGETALYVRHASGVASRTVAQFENLNGNVMQMLGDGRTYFGTGGTSLTSLINIDQGSGGTTPLTIRGNSATITQEVFRESGTAFATAFSRGRMRNDNTIRDVSYFGVLGDNNIGATPSARYVMIGAGDDASWNNAALKVDANFRVGIALTGTDRPTHTLQVNGDSLFQDNMTVQGSVTATDFITTSKVADVTRSNKALDNLNNIDKWLNKDGSIAYDKHYAHIQQEKQRVSYYINVTYEEEICEEISFENEKTKDITFETKCETIEVIEQEPVYETYLQDGLSMETRIAEMELMIKELKEQNKDLQQENQILKQELCNLGSKASWCNIK